MNDRRGVHLDDDGRPAHAVAGPQLGTFVDFNGGEIAIEKGLVLLDHRVRGVRAVLVEFRQADFLYCADSDRAQVDELHGLVELEAINPFVRQAKARGEVIKAATADPVGIDFERKLVPLPEIADIGLVIEPLPALLDPLLAQPLPGIAPELGQNIADLAYVGVVRKPRAERTPGVGGTITG
jgi:hypothetical protein